MQQRETEILFPPHDSINMARLIGLFRRQLKLNDDDRNTAKFLFDTATPPHEIADTSYYSVYRFGLTRNRIVKTFIAIKGPRAGRFGCFTFTHVYTDSKARIRRLTHGGVLSFDKSIYFLGASANDRGDSTRNRGLKIMAVPHDELINDHGFAGGVYLSNAADWQPIVGRMALLHLGFRSRIGEQDHKTADVHVLDGEKRLAADMEAQCQKLQTTRTAAETEQMTARLLATINNAYPDGNSKRLLRAVTAASSW